MIVVPVLITNCQVSEKPNSGPVIAQTKTTPAASMKADARPAAWDVLFATSPKIRLKPPACPADAFVLASWPTIDAFFRKRTGRAGAMHRDLFAAAFACRLAVYTLAQRHHVQLGVGGTPSYWGSESWRYRGI